MWNNYMGNKHTLGIGGVDTCVHCRTDCSHVTGKDHKGLAADSSSKPHIHQLHVGSLDGGIGTVH